MVMVEEFNKLYDLLSKNDKKILSKECLQSMGKERVYLDKGIVLDKFHALDTYRNRYKIQLEVTKKNIVNGYEELLESLQDEGDREILVHIVTANSAAYIIFSSLNLDRLIGTLKSLNSNADKLKEINKVYKEKGMDVSSRQFYKGTPTDSDL